MAVAATWSAELSYSPCFQDGSRNQNASSAHQVISVTHRACRSQRVPVMKATSALVAPTHPGRKNAFFLFQRPEPNGFVKLSQQIQMFSRHQSPSSEENKQVRVSRLVLLLLKSAFLMNSATRHTVDFTTRQQRTLHLMFLQVISSWSRDLFLRFHSPPVQSGTGGPCDPGHHCPEGSANQIPCSPGTYNPMPLQVSCFNCPAGYYCEQGATHIIDCPKGKCNVIEWESTAPDPFLFSFFYCAKSIYGLST